MIYVVSDLHFFHADLLTSQHFAPRPFGTVAKMHETIINNWNARVQPTDTVYHLGDIAMLNRKPSESNPMILAVLKQLNGHLVLIKGNHDSRALFKYLAANNYELADRQLKFQFEDVGTYFKMNHYQFYLTHYPMLFGVNQNLINLHGHIHNATVPIKENLNVGIDSPEKDYLHEPIPFGAPFSETEIFEMIQGKRDDFAKRR